MKKYSVLMIVICFISFFAVNAFAQETMTLTIPLPLSGDQATFGAIGKRSYEIAAEEINAAGGIKGKKIVLEFADSQGRPALARSIVKKLIKAKKQPMVFGEYSSACSRAVAALAEERKVPYLVVSGAADAITQEGYGYVFRMNTPNAYYAKGLMSFLDAVVKPRTAATLYEDSDFGISNADAFSREMEKAGIAVLWEEPYATAAFFGEEAVHPVDIKLDVKKLKYLKSDVIYMVSYEKDAVKLMELLKKNKVDAKLFAGGAAGFAIPDFIKNAKGAAEYVVISSLWSPGIGYPGAKAFAEKYKKRFKDDPSYHGAEAYAALFVVKDALERAKTWNPDDIRDALLATNMMTAFGPVKFENREGYSHQNFMDTIVMQVIKGQFEVIWPEKYATKKYVYPIPSWSQRK